MKDKKIRVELLADRLQNLLQLVDEFMVSLEEDDFELLEETKECLINKISTNNGALPLIMACGGNYDDTEDRAKLETLECIITMINIRKELRDYLVQAEKQKDNMKEVLKIFGAM